MVSVVMATYKEDVVFVQEAVESILGQTYSDFEFIIINDRPDDRVIHQYIISLRDSRIRYFRNDNNAGLAVSLNRAIKLSGGEYIFRMDADDVSERDRIERQVDYLDRHPEIAVLGSWVYTIDENGRRTGLSKCPVNHDRIKASTILGAPMFHPSVVFRREVFEKWGLYYDESFKYAQDYELWARAVHRVQFANTEGPLLSWRNSLDRVSSRNFREQFFFTKKIHESVLERIHVFPSHRQIRLHFNLFTSACQSFSDLLLTFRWILFLIVKNRKAGVFSQSEMNKTLAYHYRIMAQRCPFNYVGYPLWMVLKIFSYIL